MLILLQIIKCFLYAYVYTAKIVCGSINGTVRIYIPVEREYKIEHLILEQDLGKPILQISQGYFASYVYIHTVHI